MKKLSSSFVSAVSAVVSAVVTTAEHELSLNGKKASLSDAVSNLYRLIKKGDTATAVRIFGNGLTGKQHIAGELAGELRKAIAAYTLDAKGEPLTGAELAAGKVRQTKALNVLKQRASEARRLFAAGVVLKAGESVQTALKSVPKASAPAEQKATAEAPAAWCIPADASMDDIAEQLSIWVAKHGNAASGLAAKLADFMPVSVKRQRAA